MSTPLSDSTTLNLPAPHTAPAPSPPPPARPVAAPACVPTHVPLAALSVPSLTFHPAEICDVANGWRDAADEVADVEPIVAISSGGDAATEAETVGIALGDLADKAAENMQIFADLLSGAIASYHHGDAIQAERFALSPR